MMTIFWNYDCLVFAHSQMKGETLVSGTVKCYRTSQSKQFNLKDQEGSHKK